MDLVEISGLRFLQINLRKSSSANENAIDFAIKNNIDILLVQDLHISNDNLIYLPVSCPCYLSLNKSAGIILMNGLLIHIKTVSLGNSVFINVTMKDFDLLVGLQYSAPRKNPIYNNGQMFFQRQKPNHWRRL